jgi:arylsulfatase A-like enzyme
MNISRFSITRLAMAVGIGLFVQKSWADGHSAKPNVVLILADDLGYADVGYHGCEDALTPHIDSIANNGVQFTQGYVTGPVCSPTRAGLMTGRYQQRFGSESNPGPFVRRGEVGGVSLSVRMAGDYFKELGYRTACFGKWHLGGERGNTSLFPLNRGFDEFFGFLEGAACYEEDVHNVQEKYMRGNVLVEREGDYYTDAIGREAVSFIERQEDDPFFLYLTFSAVHAPMEAKAEYQKRFADIPDEGRRKLCAMLWSMDENIGRVLDVLRETGAMDNTLIFFLSDNGGKPKNNFSLNHPYRGEKGEFYDGGIHIPFCMQWNGRIDPGSIYQYPVSSLDILPTSLAAAGQSPGAEAFDGINLLPFLSGENKGRPHSVLYWKLGNKSAIRMGDWKIVKTRGKTELFNLSDDPSEEQNLAASHPEKLRALQEKYARWDRDNIPVNYGWDPAIGPKQEPPKNWKKDLK